MKDYITLALVETPTGSTLLCAAPAYRIREGDTVVAEKSDLQWLCKVLATKIARVDECGFELRIAGRGCNDVHDIPRITAKTGDIGDPFEDEPSLEGEDGPASE